LYDAFIYPTSLPGDPTPAYLVDYPTPLAESSADTETPLLAKHLKRYVLRSKVKLRDVTEEYDTWSVLNSTLDASKWSPEQTWKMGSGGAAEITWDLKGDEGVKRIAGRDTEVGSWDLRAGWGSGSMGRRFLVRRGDRRQWQIHTPSVILRI
jgi:hypothetical protein